MVDQPADGVYPEYWEADVVLRDGGTAHLRPIHPSDADAVQAFHVGQSQNSIYMRFFAFKARLSSKELKRFTEVDYKDRVALVITIGGEIIGHRPLRPAGRPRGGRGGLQHRRRPPGPRASAPSCWSTSRPPPAKTGSASSAPKCCRKTARCSWSSPTPATTSNAISTTAWSAWSSTSTPPDKSRAVMESREHRAEARSIQDLLAPVAPWP